jgi:cytochrome c
MRRLVATSLALTLAAGLAGCGKSQTQSQNQGAQATSSAQPANPQATQAAALTPDEMKKVQASLPAPYNTADLTNGQAKFAFCSACHTITPGGPNMTGPNLHGVVGRKAGTAADYNYSDAVKNAGFTWDAAHLDKWLTNPQAMLPGTKMTFPGLKDPKDRTDVIAYLMVNSAPKP